METEKWAKALKDGLDIQADGAFTKRFLKHIGHLLFEMRSKGDWPAMEEALKDLGFVFEDETTWDTIRGKEIGILALACVLKHREGLLVSAVSKDRVADAVRLLDFLLAKGWARKRSVLLVMTAAVATRSMDLFMTLFETRLLGHFVLEPHDFVDMGGELCDAPTWKAMASTCVDRGLTISLPAPIGPWTKARPSTLTWKDNPALKDDLFTTLFASLHTYLAEEYGRRGISAFDALMAHAKTKSYMAVVDGANVLYYGKRSLDHSSLTVLNALCHNLALKGLRPLIVLHERHKPHERSTPYERSKPNRQHPFFATWSSAILWTSKGLNDDWFAIGAALQAKALLVTNDLFRDHINAWATTVAGTLTKTAQTLVHPWAEGRHVRYAIKPHWRDGYQVDFSMPSPIAKRIHPLIPVIHPPTAAGTPPTFSFAAVIEGERDSVAVL